jgi:PAS domain S-box-containing protein
VVAELTYALRAEAVFEAAPDAIVGVDPGGRILLANAQAERLFGYQRDELIGRPLQILVPNAVQELQEAGLTSAGAELVGRRKDGTEFPAEIALSAVHTDEGLVVTAASVRDLSDRKNAEAERLTIEVAPDAILGVDASGSIKLVNAQCERLFGYGRDDLLGRPLERVIPAGLGPVEAGRFGAVLELAALRHDGAEIIVEVSLSALVRPGGILTLAAVRDITERRRFEALLREQNIGLERASRAKDNFLASMSHELRTPLNAIIGFTGTMLMKLPGPLNEVQEHQLRLVQSSGKHLLSIINDLLDLAKIESGTVQISLEPVDLSRVIDDVVQSLRPQAEAKGIALRIADADTTAMAIADRRALGQILINLVNNAIKFTAAGEVLVRLLPADAEGRLTISVSDTGPGIPAADLVRIFHAFERSAATAKATDEGTGLGLHISQRLALLLDGTITVASVVGEGSTFTVSLPGR